MRHLMIGLIGLFVLAGCVVPPGQVRKHTTPGHIQQQTGYNPASGKYHPKKKQTSQDDATIIIHTH